MNQAAKFPKVLPASLCPVEGLFGALNPLGQRLPQLSGKTGLKGINEVINSDGRVPLSKGPPTPCIPNFARTPRHAHATRKPRVAAKRLGLGGWGCRSWPPSCWSCPPVDHRHGLVMGVEGGCGVVKGLWGCVAFLSLYFFGGEGGGGGLVGGGGNDPPTTHFHMFVLGRVGENCPLTTFEGVPIGNFLDMLVEVHVHPLRRFLLTFLAKENTPKKKSTSFPGILFRSQHPEKTVHL